MKLKNDSVDEVDTTDLENWVLKGRPFMEPMEEQEEDMLEYKLFMDSEVSQLDPNFVSDEKLKQETERILRRHRLDLAKLYLMKDGGYSLRKFKKIFKREMEENPHKYLILNSKQGKTTIETTSEVKDEDDESVVTKSEEQKGEDEIKEEDPQIAKTKAREQAKKEIDEMNADSEDETYDF